MDLVYSGQSRVWYFCPRAFIAFQKGLELAELAHNDDEKTTTGLVQANRYYEFVLERVPDFSAAWSAHSDLNMHKVLDDMDKPFGEPADAGITEVFELVRADYEKAIRWPTWYTLSLTFRRGYVYHSRVPVGVG